MTSDMHLPPEKLRQLPTLGMGVCVTQISGMTRHHLAICSHLWTSSYYQKWQHFRSRATSALILCSFLHVGATSWRARASHARSTRWDLAAARRPGPGLPPQAELRAPWQLSPAVRRFRAGGRLAGTPLPAWPGSLLCASCHSQQLDLLASRGFSGPVRRPHLRDHVSGHHRACRLHCNLHRAKRPDSVLLPGSGQWWLICQSAGPLPLPARLAHSWLAAALVGPVT